MRLLALLLLAFTLHAAEPAKPAESDEVKHVRALISDFNHRWESDKKSEPSIEMRQAIVAYYMDLYPKLDLKKVDEDKVKNANEGNAFGGAYNDNVRLLAEEKSEYDEAKTADLKSISAGQIADRLGNNYFSQYQLKLKGQRIISMQEWGIKGGYTH